MFLFVCIHETHVLSFLCVYVFSSRATYGGRKRQDDNEVMEGGGGVRMFCGGKRYFFNRFIVVK